MYFYKDDLLFFSIKTSCWFRKSKKGTKFEITYLALTNSQFKKISTDEMRLKQMRWVNVMAKIALVPSYCNDDLSIASFCLIMTLFLYIFFEV